MTFYLAPALLVATQYDGIPGATGALVWVREAGHEACPSLAVHPALLVQTAAISLQRACVELVPHLPADDPLRHHMVLVLQTVFEAEGMAGRLYAAVLADALALHFFRRYAACRHTAPDMNGGLSPAKLRRTIAYIQAHLGQELSLTTLAALVHLSLDHFARLFKQATGQTPHQYVLGCRIARAKQLLAETDMPLSEIGLQVGCTDQSYFTALFRQHVTMTPKAYRDATAKT
jgi:AraC family transcriptional regulator